jgi:carboxymethylenebutenolidase
MVNRIAVLAPELNGCGRLLRPAAAGEPGESDPGALLLHYAGLDQRINAGIATYEAALKADNKRFTIYVYPNVNHAFNNDTSNRYDKPAAYLAWSRTVAFFKDNLGVPPG